MGHNQTLSHQQVLAWSRARQDRLRDLIAQNKAQLAEIDRQQAAVKDLHKCLKHSEPDVALYNAVVESEQRLREAIAEAKDRQAEIKRLLLGQARLSEAFRETADRIQDIIDNGGQQSGGPITNH